ncbi:hypothetical protein PanWU01x14_315480, partial [Parasponia andersonii]
SPSTKTTKFLPMKLTAIPPASRPDVPPRDVCWRTTKRCRQLPPSYELRRRSLGCPKVTPLSAIFSEMMVVSCRSSSPLVGMNSTHPLRQSTSSFMAKNNSGEHLN